jgi:hypothetical protein
MAEKLLELSTRHPQSSKETNGSGQRNQIAQMAPQPAVPLRQSMKGQR